MANYNLVIDSKYDPFTFDELLKPALMATQAHREVENQIADLDAKASIWEKLEQDARDRDSKAYKRYKSYAEDLRGIADELASNGLNPSSRQGALKMKSRYSTEISPIEEAYVKRAKDAEQQAQNKLRGIVYDTYASQTSLDDYISNPNLQHAGADINEGYKRVGAAASALAKQLRNYGTGKNIDAYTKTFLQEHGYKESEVNQAIRDIQGALNGDGNYKGNGILQSILMQEMQTSGVGNWSNKDSINDYFNRISPAIYQSVGQTSVSPMDDYAARYNLQHTPTGANRLAINPLNIYSSVEQTKASKAIKDFSKYFKRNAKGELKLTKEGQEEYNKRLYNWSSNQMPSTIGAISTGRSESNPSNFRQFMDEIGATPKDIEHSWEKWYTANKDSKYDSKKVTEFDYDFDQGDSEQKNIKGRIASGMANGDSSLYEVDFDSSTNKFERTGNHKMNLEELMDSKTKVLTSRPSAYGTSIIIEREGKKYRYEMPSGINTTNENARNFALGQAAKIARRLQDPRLNDYTRSKYEEDYDYYLQQGIWHHSQLFGNNKTESTKFERRGF